MEQSLNEIVRRHEVLRTTFAVADGQPVQVIAPELTLRLPVVDCRGFPADAGEDEIKQPFDLTQGPLVRATLFRLDQQEHILLLTLHHTVADDQSIEVLTRELATLYAAFTAGQPSPLAALPMQYADYALWQRQWLQGEPLEALLAYWKQQLDGAPSVLELPTDRPRPAVQSYRGARQSVVLPTHLAVALREFSCQEGVDLFMTLLAAFQTLLHRYTAADDLVVGTPVANRRPETEGLIGPLVNTLALRADLSGNPTFRELLGQVREVVLGAYAHEDLPFAQLVETLQPQRNLSHAPLFQVLFAFQNALWPALDLGGLTLRPQEVESGTAKFDVSLFLWEDTGRLRGAIEYNTDLFDDTTMARMLGHFQTVLEGIVACPTQRLWEVPLLTEVERQQLLVAWNATQTAYSKDVCLHQLVEVQVERSPHAVAVAYEDVQLTYRELNARANQLAHYLRRLGVGPEALVGICMERSVEMVVGLLGILKAGGAYVPLDPAYPKERLAFMLEDTQTPVLLTQQGLVEALPPHGARVVCLDTDWETVVQESEENPASRVTADHLAYVIFTSGSTGKPKGAMNTHRGICNRLLWMQDAYQLTEADRVLQKTPFSFDVSVWEFFWPLLTGACLVVARPNGHQDSAYLVKLIADQDITVLHFVPSMLQLFLEAQGLEACTSLRHVICSGEALPVELQERFLTRLPAQLHNLYGPTEAAVDVTFWPCQPQDNQRLVPIGRPIANTQIYILDAHLQPVPVGVPGELYIGGVGVARGYLNRPALTAERFISDPFSDAPRARLYKTGDLARYRPDGAIEFLGRLDYQVKIRGFRIELGEIEAVLGQHPDVREAVVLAREDVPGEKRLVAYVVPRQQPTPSLNDLRHSVKETLPDYMVPAAFVTLQALPLLPNGKVNRQALPAPGTARPELEEAFVAPRTAIECFVAKVWQELLRVETVGIHDNFFELGGDSIKGAVFINRLQEALGEVVHIVVLFDAPTIAELTQYLHQHYLNTVSELFSDAAPYHTGTGKHLSYLRQHEKIDASKVEQIRTLITPLAPHSPSPRRQTSVGGLSAVNAMSSADSTDEPVAVRSTSGIGRKNPPAIFVLAPPRSGSTLLRVMLAGHPLLFAPPELELLSFNTLAERKAAFSGRNSFWLEGVIRAMMEIKNCDAERAKSMMEDCEHQKLTTQQFYQLMQEWIGEKCLVDKTPSYALDAEILKRSETDFENAFYIHLLRHPYGMIRSFEKAKLDQVFFRYEHRFPIRELAELIWLVSHQNILEFLKCVPHHRQYRVKFEDLVNQPQAMMEGLCQRFGLVFHPDMVKPYKDKENRMTDGIYTVSRMLGDVKFHEYTDIDPNVAERWKTEFSDDFLGDMTWQVAELLGYEKPIQASEHEDLARIIAELEGLSEEEVKRLLA
jgi:amino acid adenylation domain-containing protein